MGPTGPGTSVYSGFGGPAAQGARERGGENRTSEGARRRGRDRFPTIAGANLASIYDLGTILDFPQSNGQGQRPSTTEAEASPETRGRLRRKSKRFLP